MSCGTANPVSSKGASPASALPGILAMCGGVFCLALSDASAKWLVADYSPLQIVFMRNFLALPLVFILVVRLGGWGVLATPHLKMHALRGLLLLGVAFTFFASLAFLPLAQAMTLVFSAPICVTALSVVLLGEKVGRRRWLGVLAGFVGVVIVVRPGALAMEPALLLPLLAAIFYALVMLSARAIGSSERVWTMMFYVVLFPLVFSALLVPLVWITPLWADMPYFMSVAFFGTIGMTLLTQAFRLAPMSVVAPFDYTALLWTSLLGWLIWAEVPRLSTYVGAAIIIGSGIYITYREVKRAPAKEL